MSGARFGPAAMRLAGLAARTLGWPPDLFWNATPAELAMSLTDPSAQPAPLARADLHHLMESDPDGPS